VIITPALPEHWPQIWPIVRDVTTAGDTYPYPTDMTEHQAKDVWMEKPPGLTVVALDEGGVVLGTAKTGPNRSGPGAHVATGSFMVGTDSRGQGVGRALGEYVVAWAREQGYRSIQFNAVVETNTVAVNLWKSLGFEVLGTVPEAFLHPTHGYVGLHLMFQRLDG
jgi:GNAT superfamily N-acetyltransferase